jgi:hypothetical protein
VSRPVIDDVARRDPQVAGESGETWNPRLQVVPEFGQDLTFVVLDPFCGQAAYLGDLDVLYALFETA